ncbi:MAG: hypothetical protein L3K16_03800 [Thermoplasmata archaeon]|nr:hypothetical protein [Thermoplasmata archaeon]
MEIAEKWASTLGDTTGQTDGADPKGSRLTALAIQHGPATLIVAEQNEVIVLIAGLEFPAQLRAQVNQLPQKTQEKILYTIKQVLMENARVAWQMQPATVTRLGELGKLQLSIFMRLDEKNTETFNGFADAIQELTTLVVRVGVVVGQVFTGGSTSGNEVPNASIYR